MGFSISVILLALILIPFSITCFFKIKLFSQFLKENYYERWKYLTTVGGFSGGGANASRWLKYLKCQEDEEILEITKYKDEIRIKFRYFLSIAAGIIVNSIILIVLAVLYNS